MEDLITKAFGPAFGESIQALKQLEVYANEKPELFTESEQAKFYLKIKDFSKLHDSQLKLLTRIVRTLISQYGIKSVPIEDLLKTQNKIVISIFSELIPELRKSDQEKYVPILHEIAITQSVGSNSSNELIECLEKIGGKVTIDYFIKYW